MIAEYSGINLLLALALILIESIWIYKYKDNGAWRYAFPLFVWAIHLTAFYGVLCSHFFLGFPLFAPLALMNNWSSLVRMHGTITILIMEGGKLWTKLR